MNRHLKSLLPAALMLLASANAWAADGRDFAAFYQPADVTPVGEEVLLTFSVDLFNFSGEGVVGATVDVRGFLIPEVYASFPAVDLADRDRVRLTREVTLPAAELAAWERGAAPRLILEFLDAAGESRFTTAETSRSILTEEEP